jgi:hypothetical protein
MLVKKFKTINSSFQEGWNDFLDNSNSVCHKTDLIECELWIRGFELCGNLYNGEIRKIMWANEENCF